MSQVNLTEGANTTLTTWGDSTVSNCKPSLTWTSPVGTYTYWDYPHYIREDAMRKAFSIVKHLMKKKLVKKPLTVEQFVDLVDEVYKLL